MYNSSISDGPNPLNISVTDKENLTVLFDPEVCGNLTEEYMKVRTC